MMTTLPILARFVTPQRAMAVACLCLAETLAPCGIVMASDDAPDSVALEAKVIAFCKSHMGEKVGNGQCAGLAFQALKAAGARPRGGADSPEKGDYVWGREILLVESGPNGVKMTGDWKEVRPGDIVQYHDTKFVTAHFAHHTSIVREMSEKSLKVYQQHVNGTEIVGEGAVRLDKLSQGWLRFYRPLPER
jgi:hypothetical protein